MKKFLVLILVLGLTVSLAYAEDIFPPAGWKDQPNPLASPDASVGGEISSWAGQFPKSLNNYLDTSSQSGQIFGAIFETLLSLNPLTLEYEPGLAAKWSISDDKKVFTFYIDKRARWSDGTPITAHDVKWTYNAIMNPKNLTGPYKVDMERFEVPQVLDKYTIQFVAKDVHWKNLGAAGNFYILCKRAYEGRDFNKINFDFPVVSGPYKLGEIIAGTSASLKLRSNWWNINAPSAQGTNNFETIRFRFFAERENAFEAFKKGTIDLYPVYTARQWIKETKSEKFTQNWIVKQKVLNHAPFGFQGFAMNMRQAPFDDVRTRKAMAYLLDRRKMNSSLMYNQYFLHRSYYEDLYSQNIPCPNPLIEMDKEKARTLLRQAGWKVNPQTGFLEKNSQKFSFKFLTRAASSDKFLAIYAEDLKDVGIELVIDRKDWAAWARDMDEFNFQMTWAAWGAGVFKDPENMWSSREAERKGGVNITGFKSATVDKLIEKQKQIFDITQRNAIYRQIDQIIYQDFPYVLLWNINYTRLLYWNKFGTPDWVLSKHSRESGAYSYWWFDEDSAADLEDAVQNNTLLPPKAGTVRFDAVFKDKR